MEEAMKLLTDLDPSINNLGKEYLDKLFKVFSPRVLWEAVANSTGYVDSLSIFRGLQRRALNEGVARMSSAMSGVLADSLTYNSYASLCWVVSSSPSIVLGKFQEVIAVNESDPLLSILTGEDKQFAELYFEWFRSANVRLKPQLRLVPLYRENVDLDGMRASWHTGPRVPISGTNPPAEGICTFFVPEETAIELLHHTACDVWMLVAEIILMN